MKSKNIKIPWWLKWAIKKALEWLVREILKELEEGIRVRVVVDGKPYYVKISIDKEPSRSSAPVLLL